jgi:hypothetical protein
MHVQAEHASETVMEAYHKAASFVEESSNLKHQVYLHENSVDLSSTSDTKRTCTCIRGSHPIACSEKPILRQY